MFDRRPRTKAVSRDAIAAAETELAALPADIAAEFPLEQGGALEIAQDRGIALAEDVCDLLSKRSALRRRLK